MEEQEKTTKAQVRCVRLWETPIFLVKNPEHFDIKQGLKDFIYSEEKKQYAPIDSNVAISAKGNLKESKFDFLERDNEDVDRLTNFITQAVMSCIGTVNGEAWQKYERAKIGTPELEIHESWYHITKNGGYHAGHSHAGCSWCGIYYVDVGDWDEDSVDNMVFSSFGRPIVKTKGGKNRFYKPFNHSYYDAGMDYFMATNEFAPEPEDGLMVIFPSYLMHCADPYGGTEKDRIVIAFNMKIDVTKEEEDAQED